jgi:hypothetical protein
MACEFIVKRRAAEDHGKSVACGRTANYFSVQGPVGEIRMWLCDRHEHTIVEVYHWQVHRLSPPDPPPDPAAAKGAE